METYSPILYITIGLNALVIFSAGMVYMRVLVNTGRIAKLEDKANHLSSLEKLQDLWETQDKEMERIRTRLDMALDRGGRFLDKPGDSQHWPTRR